MKSNYRRLFKKIDNSSLHWGITIPKDLVQDFLSGKNLPARTSREIDIIWDRWAYLAKINHGVTRGHDYYQIRYDHNPELLKRLRKTFIQSYVILKSQKELFDSIEEKKQFRSKLTGGQQEVLIVQPIDYKTVSFKVFIKIENEWNTLFQRLADENVFGWLFDKDKQYLISRSTNWIKRKDFDKHKNATFVIYYLVHSEKRLIYIGKANNLGKRVKPGRRHQEMPGDWDLFKYDIVKPEYSNLLERIEDHTIRSFASFFRNDQNYPSTDTSPYRLVNTNWKKL